MEVSKQGVSVEPAVHVRVAPDARHRVPDPRRWRRPVRVRDVPRHLERRRCVGGGGALRRRERPRRPPLVPDGAPHPQIVDDARVRSVSAKDNDLALRRAARGGVGARRRRGAAWESTRAKTTHEIQNTLTSDLLARSSVARGRDQCSYQHLCRTTHSIAVRTGDQRHRASPPQGRPLRGVLCRHGPREQPRVSQLLRMVDE